MKHKLVVFSVIVAAIFLSSFVLEEPILEWKINFEESKSEAKDSNKLILLSFAGSDWCANCIRLDRTLFQSEEFGVYAKDNLILLKADFPMKSKNKLSKEQTKHNEALAEKYNKGGAFPTVLILDAEGNVKGKLQHPLKSVADYLKNIHTIVESK